MPESSMGLSNTGAVAEVRQLPKQQSSSMVLILMAIIVASVVL
jgi:hypothetical protein